LGYNDQETLEESRMHGEESRILEKLKGLL
jgi:ssRNA-specific RNase YbeY (16S rRNA maturation enzyme)